MASKDESLAQYRMRERITDIIENVLDVFPPDRDRRYLEGIKRANLYAMGTSR